VAHPSGVQCRSLAHRTIVDPAHRTPLGCGPRTDHVSINIAPLRGASPKLCWGYCWDLQTLNTLLGCGLFYWSDCAWLSAGDITRLLSEEIKDGLISCVRLICRKDVACIRDHHQPGAGDQPRKTPAILGRNQPV
jgi:hypothetical protein